MSDTTMIENTAETELLSAQVLCSTSGQIAIVSESESPRESISINNHESGQISELCSTSSQIAIVSESPSESSSINNHESGQISVLCSTSSQIAIVSESPSESSSINNHESGQISEESSHLLEQNGSDTNENVISRKQSQPVDEMCRILGDNLSEASFPSQLIGFDRDDDHYNRTSGKYQMFPYDIENQRKNEAFFLSMCINIPERIRECMICGKDELDYCRCRSRSPSDRFLDEDEVEVH
jgi:hypothetical protein